MRITNPVSALGHGAGFARRSSIFLVSMLSPYASNQGMIVPLALVPSWSALALQYVVLFTSSSLDVFRENSAWFALLFGQARCGSTCPAQRTRRNRLSRSRARLALFTCPAIGSAGSGAKRCYGTPTSADASGSKRIRYTWRYRSKSVTRRLKRSAKKTTLATLTGASNLDRKRA